jgi:hypothetical protein
VPQSPQSLASTGGAKKKKSTAAIRLSGPLKLNNDGFFIT